MLRGKKHWRLGPVAGHAGTRATPRTATPYPRSDGTEKRLLGWRDSGAGGRGGREHVGGHGSGKLGFLRASHGCADRRRGREARLGVRVGHVQVGYRMCGRGMAGRQLETRRVAGAACGKREGINRGGSSFK